MRRARRHADAHRCGRGRAAAPLDRVHQQLAEGIGDRFAHVRREIGIELRHHGLDALDRFAACTARPARPTPAAPRSPRSAGGSGASSTSRTVCKQRRATSIGFCTYLNACCAHRFEQGLRRVVRGHDDDARTRLCVRAAARADRGRSSAASTHRAAADRSVGCAAPRGPRRRPSPPSPRNPRSSGPCCSTCRVVRSSSTTRMRLMIDSVFASAGGACRRGAAARRGREMRPAAANASSRQRRSVRAGRTNARSAVVELVRAAHLLELGGRLAAGWRADGGDGSLERVRRHAQRLAVALRERALDAPKRRRPVRHGTARRSASAAARSPPV